MRHKSSIIRWLKFPGPGFVKQVRTPPVRPADGVVGLFYESFVPGEDCCELGLRAKIKSAEHAPAL